jgi:hypothetical protein
VVSPLYCQRRIYFTVISGLISELNIDSISDYVNLNEEGYINIMLGWGLWCSDK